jgi:general transcription factor 3C polypeptide 3 (transcription factor C subunit 4)
MINFTIGLTYVHYALKRQAENRQHLILTGLAFLFRYYDTRKQSPEIEERQEAHYNIARAYHLLGLSQLSLPYYLRVLQEVKGDGALMQEDLVIDAAYNLQTIYVMAGNQELARAITEQWLVV